MDLKSIKDQLGWAKENIDNPMTNLDIEDVEFLITQAEKVEEQRQIIEELEKEKSFFIKAYTEKVMKDDDA